MTTPGNEKQPKRATPDPQKPLRARFLRFSLRSVLILVTSICLGLGWFIPRVQTQKEVVQYFENNQISYSYDHELSELNRWQRWLASKLGEDAVRSVDYARVTNQEQFRQATRLRWLKSLFAANGVSDISALSRMTKLETLALSPEVSDLSPIRNCRKLKHLAANGCEVTRGFDLLRRMPDLEYVYLCSAKPESLACLKGLTKMKHLFVNGEKLTSIDALSSLHELTSLDLRDVKAQDYQPLSKLKKLEVLRLTRSSIKDLTPLSELKSLGYLSLKETAVEDIGPLAKLDQITTLDISAPVADLSPLRNMQRLRWLSVIGVAADDYSVLEHCPGVEHIRITGDQVGPELTFGPNNLKHLTVANAKNLKTIVGGEFLGGIHSITLENTGIENLELGLPKSLMQVTINDCPIKSLDALKKCAHLSELTISNCPITELPNFENRTSLRFDLIRILDTKMKDLTSIGSQLWVHRLSIRGLDFESLDGAESIRNMYSANIKRTSIDSVALLSANGSLNKFSLESNPNLSEFKSKPIEGNLREVHILNCPIQDFRELLARPDVERVAVFNVGVSEEDWEQKDSIPNSSKLSFIEHDGVR